MATGANSLMGTSCDVAETARSSGRRRCHTRPPAMVWIKHPKADKHVVAKHRMKLRCLGSGLRREGGLSDQSEGRALGARQQRRARHPTPIRRLPLKTGCNIVGQGAVRCCQERDLKAPIPKGVSSSPGTTVSQWLTDLAPCPNPYERRAFCASAGQRTQTRSRGLCATLPTQVGRLGSDLCSKHQSARKCIQTQAETQAPRTAFRSAGQDQTRRCHDNSTELCTVAFSSESQDGRGIESCDCHRLCLHATKCRRVGSHVVRCKQNSVTEWSQSLVLSASWQRRGF